MRGIQSVTSMFDTVEIFSFICNKKHAVIWKNQYAKNSGIDLQIGDNIYDFFREDHGSLDKCLAAADSHTVFQAEVHYFSGAFLLEATGFQDEEQGFCTWWCMKSRIPDLLHRYFSPETEEAGLFGTEYRESVFQIYNALSPVALALEKNGCYEALEYLNIISKGAHNIFKTTVNLTEYFKFETESNYMRTRHASVLLLLTDLMNGVELLTRDCGRTIKFEARCPDVMINVDAEKLVVAMLNLLVNAIDFSVADTQITVTLEQQEQNVLLFVRDIGDGIAPENLSKAAEPFYSYQESTRNRHGLGLGLYVSKRIVEAHGGAIWITGKPNEGTTVCISLPAVSLNRLEAKPLRSSVISNLISNKMSVLHAFLAPYSKSSLF